MYENNRVSSIIWERTDAPKVQAQYPLLRKELTIEWCDMNNRSFIIVAHPLAVWPPPISLGPGDVESTYWSFKLKDTLQAGVALKALVMALNQDHVRYFCTMVCDHLKRVSVETDLLVRSLRRGPLLRTSGTWCSSVKVDSLSETLPR
jgi:hypothetical protein